MVRLQGVGVQLLAVVAEGVMLLRVVAGGSVGQMAASLQACVRVGSSGTCTDQLHC